MNYKLLILLFLCMFSFGFINKAEDDGKIKNTEAPITKKILADNIKTKKITKTSAELFFESIEKDKFNLPNFECFSKAFEGYNQLRKQNLIQKNFLTIIDFSLSSNEERLWVIDMSTKKVVLKSLVAHGRNSGDEFATSFSNNSESYQSSLGFYSTGETYEGKHGLSLRLDGLEYGINNRARERAIVIHSADYVSAEFANNNGRLGRSQGCPAVPVLIHKKFINLIKDKSCLFIYHPSRNYIAKSKLVS